MILLNSVCVLLRARGERVYYGIVELLHSSIIMIELLICALMFAFIRARSEMQAFRVMSFDRILKIDLCSIELYGASCL